MRKKRILDRDARMQFRVTSHFKEIVEDAAESIGMSSAEFIRACILSAIYNGAIPKVKTGKKLQIIEVNDQ
jgi:uncharacterized protein (DUF1778 family)